MSADKQNRFSGRWGFILSAVGSAVGLINVWAFPAKLGANGGSAFLIAYLFFVVLFSVLGLSVEYAVGRKFRTGPLGAFRGAWASRRRELAKAGAIVGWLPLVGALLIALGYAVVVAYVLKAFVASLSGELMTADTTAWFDSFSRREYSVVPYHIIVIISTLMTLLLGAKSIEKTNKIMMPLFFGIFLLLAVRVAFIPGAASGYRFMFTPDWSALKDPMVWIWAMGQAFFSLSVTGSGMITYGAYLDEGEDVVSLATRTAVFDSVAAIVSALVIIPACFAYGIDVRSGPALLFETLPRILQDIPLGRLFAAVLYIALIFAGVSSLQNILEAVAESLEKRFKKMSRKGVLAIIGALCLAIGVHMESIDVWGPWMDLVSIYVVPIGATLGAVSWFWIMRKEDLMSEINRGGRKPLGEVWYRTGRYLYVPCAVVLCLVALIMKIPF